MTAVPAQVAGVRRIAVITPRPVDAILVVARELGIGEVYAIGGAQGVAALAFGTASIPAVDKIVGPGNAYVTAAKLLVSTHVGIDLPAGPSEVVVIADATADPAHVAADLLAQAEHGPESEALLLTDDPALSGAVSALVAGYDNIVVELVASLGDALARSEAYAPEHLELLVADPEALLGSVRNAGSVFVGTSAVVGDYAAGATHVLPDGRSRAGLRWARSRVVPEAAPDRAGRPGRGGGGPQGGRPDRARGGAAAARCGARRPGRGGGSVSSSGAVTGANGAAARAIRLPGGFAPYVWAPKTAEIAARHGLRPEQVVRFDQNTPPFPGVPQIPLAAELCAAQRVSRRHLPCAPRGRSRLRRRRRDMGAGRRRRRGRPADPPLCAYVPRAGPAGGDLQADLHRLRGGEPPGRGRCRGRASRAPT